MITIQEALDRILEHVPVLSSEEVSLAEALGRVLDEDIAAGFDIPPLDNTAMDGYAVRAADTAGATADSPVALNVIGEVAAGYQFSGTVAPGTAVRIMTGAPIPNGADAVVPFEETDEPFDSPPSGTRTISTTVHVLKAANPGANVRGAGGDIRAGQTVVRRGTILRPSEIGVIASVGRGTVRAIRRPVVAVLSTGDELVEPGQPRDGVRIYDANASSIAALVRRYGGEPLLLGIARDTVEDVTAKLREGLAADMLVTSAGVSRGDYDVVKTVLAREGEVTFWTVAMKPGKPLAFGSFEHGGRRIPHLGLPGNPVSSMVAFELFGRPAIFKMSGRTDWRRPTVRATTEDRIENQDDPRVFLARCFLTERDGRYFVSLTGAQGSNILTSMMRANALTLIPADREVVEPGEEIEVMPLDWSHGEEWGTRPRTEDLVFDRIEDEAGRDLRVEERRLLRHPLTGVGEVENVCYRDGIEQHRVSPLAGSHVTLGLTRIFGEPDLAVVCHLIVAQSEAVSHQRVVRDRVVELPPPRGPVLRKQRVDTGSVLNGHHERRVGLGRDQAERARFASDRRDGIGHGRHLAHIEKTVEPRTHFRQWRCSVRHPMDRQHKQTGIAVGGQRDQREVLRLFARPGRGASLRLVPIPERRFVAVVPVRDVDRLRLEGPRQPLDHVGVVHPPDRVAAR